MRISDLQSFLEELPGIAVLLDESGELLGMNRAARALATAKARIYHCGHGEVPEDLISQLTPELAPAAGWTEREISCRVSERDYLVQSGRPAFLAEGQSLHIAWAMPQAKH